MTLMELLVALVIGTLVITLTVQGMGLALNLYERVGRATASLDVEYRQNNWWTDSVASLIACTDRDHCLQGTSSYFEGYTLAGVVHPPGQRVPVRWQLADKANGNGRQLRLIEGVDTSAPNSMAMTLPANARFTYLHPDGRWLSQWDIRSANGRLPKAIRIESNDRILAFAAPAQRPWGKQDYREQLGL